LSEVWGSWDGVLGKRWTGNRKSGRRKREAGRGKARKVEESKDKE
jgi:hypothetical protein